MKIKTLTEWLNESNQVFLEPTEENLREYKLDPDKVTINPDGSIDYDGDVDITWKNLTSIPFKFNKVNGDFKCSTNQLVSLEGCPEVVTGDFEGQWNQLVSLSGSPREVEGDFKCYFNQLVSLAGAPEAVKGKFDCSTNQLVSLEGSPEVVGGDFNCTYNRLVSLAGGPREVQGGFYCGLNRLVSLEGSPEVVKRKFDCSPNLILYNPTNYNGAFDINHEWEIVNSSGDWVKYSGFDYLRMAFERLDELSREEILGIEEGLKKADLPDDLRAYCEDKLYKFLVKYNPKTKTQKFFHDAEMDDDLLGML